MEDCAQFLVAQIKEGRFKLKRVQNRLIGMVIGLEDSSYMGRLDWLGLSPCICRLRRDHREV